MNRRKTIKTFALGAAAFATGGASARGILPVIKPEEVSGGTIRHSVCRWTYDFLPLEDLCREARDIGLSAIDLLAPKDWSVLSEFGLDCSMCYTGGEVSLVHGFNDVQYHNALVRDYLDVMPLMKKAGYRNLICFSGNRNGMDDETGLRNCITGLKKILGEAERSGIIVQMEVFNSKVDHPGYMADNTRWAIELCKRIGSPNFKILYDIYHMQISEGDIIRSIRDHHEYFGHYHTAGVPGRHELDDGQELNYPAIMKAIAYTGFRGYVAQEFIPTGKSTAEKIEALRDAVKRCRV